MDYAGNNTIAVGRDAEPAEDEAGVRVPGVVAAGIWAVGLLVGLIALVAGHAAVAAVALIAAITSPWLGLAWVSHSQRRVSQAWATTNRETARAGGWPALRLVAR